MKIKYTLLTILLVATGVVVIAQTGQWQYVTPNPYYLGADIGWFGDITFADSQNGFAADGFSNRLFITHDGGSSWTPHMVNSPAYYQQYLDANTGWMSDNYTLSKTTDGGITWTTQLDTTSSGMHGGSFWGLQFLNQNTGFVAGQNYIGRTNDGGAHWANIAPQNITANWSNVFFLTPDTGWIFSTDSVAAATTNGGATWTTQILGTNFNYDTYFSHFYTASTGVAINSNGAVLRTYDGGNNWVTDSYLNNVTKVKFGQGGFIYASRNGQGEIYLSTDTGRTWTTRTPPESYFGIYFFDPSHGFVGQKSIYSTSDSGQTWDADIPTAGLGNNAIMDVGMTGANSYVAYINGFDNVSTDGALNWTYNQNTNIGYVQNISATTYFARNAMQYGTMRVENGNVTYNNSSYTFIYAQSLDSFIVSRHPTNDSLIVMRTTDGGVTFSTILAISVSNFVTGGFGALSNGLLNNNNPIFTNFVSWNTGVVSYVPMTITNTTEYVTTDGGQTWKTINGTSTTYTSNIKLSPDNKLYALRHINNGGANNFCVFDTAGAWQYLSTLHANEIGTVNGSLDFNWSSDGTLWSTDAVSSYATIVYSFDNGVTWNNYHLYVNSATAMKKMPNGELWMCTAMGHILRYGATQLSCKTKGQVFYDFNANGIKDGNDQPATWYPVHLSPENYTAYAGSNGQYILASGTGVHTVYADTLTNFRAIPVSRTVGFGSVNEVSTGNDFALQAVDTNLTDLVVLIHENPITAPGFEHTTYISYANYGIHTVQPSITLALDSALSYASASINPTLQTGNVLVWGLPAVPPFQTGYFTVNSMVALSAQLGDELSNIAFIDPNINDNTPADNVDTSHFIVMGSYDPNIKTVKQQVIHANQKSAQQKLQYTIQFQNTGNAAAHLVVVKDRLPASLNPATLHIVMASHSYTYRIEDGNLLVVTFDNIMLPDSGSSQENSHGFFAFDIEPKSQILNEAAIYNSADIYFDYNSPVSTNWATTTIDHTGTDIKPVYGDLTIKVYPNPAHNIVHVESDKDFTANLFDLYGRPVLNTKSAAGQLVLNVESLSSGMYLLQIIEGERSKGYLLSVISH